MAHWFQRPLAAGMDEHQQSGGLTEQAPAVLLGRMEGHSGTVDCCLSEFGPVSRVAANGCGGWSGAALPWMPGLIWVRDLVVGDVMVDGSVHLE